jgi:hypothetical protein
LTVSGIVLDAPRICKPNHRTLVSAGQREYSAAKINQRLSPGEERKRTLEGVVESAAAFWEGVNCDGEKSGWLEGIIILSVDQRWTSLVGPPAQEGVNCGGAAWRTGVAEQPSTRVEQAAFFAWSFIRLGRPVVSFPVLGLPVGSFFILGL